MLPPPSYRKKREAALKSSGGAGKGEGEQDAKEEAAPAPAPAPAANVWKMGSAIAVVKASPAAVKSGGAVAAAGGSKVVQTSLAPSTSSAALTPTDAAPVMSPGVSGPPRREEAPSQSATISNSNGTAADSAALDAHTSLPSTGASPSSSSIKEKEVSPSEARRNDILQKAETVTPPTGTFFFYFPTTRSL